MLTHPTVERTPLYTLDVLYGDRTEAIFLHYSLREKEIIQYVDVMSLYPLQRVTGGTDQTPGG